jgi:hypothetical protein
MRKVCVDVTLCPNELFRLFPCRPARKWQEEKHWYVKHVWNVFAANRNLLLLGNSRMRALVANTTKKNKKITINNTAPLATFPLGVGDQDFLGSEKKQLPTPARGPWLPGSVECRAHNLAIQSASIPAGVPECQKTDQCRIFRVEKIKVKFRNISLDSFFFFSVA